MTVLNDLYRQAKARPAPEFVEVQWNHVGSLIEHVRATTGGFSFRDRATIRSGLIRGTMKIMGVPIRVVGIPPAILQAEIDTIEGKQNGGN